MIATLTFNKLIETTVRSYDLHVFSDILRIIHDGRENVCYAN